MRSIGSREIDCFLDSFIYFWNCYLLNFIPWTFHNTSMYAPDMRGKVNIYILLVWMRAWACAIRICNLMSVKLLFVGIVSSSALNFYPHWNFMTLAWNKYMKKTRLVIWYEMFCFFLRVWLCIYFNNRKNNINLLIRWNEWMHAISLNGDKTR